MGENPIGQLATIGAAVKGGANRDDYLFSFDRNCDRQRAAPRILIGVPHFASHARFPPMSRLFNADCGGIEKQPQASRCCSLTRVRESRRFGITIVAISHGIPVALPRSPSPRETDSPFRCIALLCYAGSFCGAREYIRGTIDSADTLVVRRNSFLVFREKFLSH